ncbi:MAG: hypothetical protein DRP50_05645 [Thermotoga sp.]|nr:monovalent cation/H(+) antiporter subunit G [Thermotogota bacterium]RKX53625.1 MAG: hypothetical protein DRP50_05645 [Thermotoga sp.]
MISIVIGIIGMLFICVGTLGGVTSKNYYVRLHLFGLSDTIGSFTLLVALATTAGKEWFWYLILGFILLIQGPVITNILAKGAAKAGIRIEEEKWHLRQ